MLNYQRVTHNWWMPFWITESTAKSSTKGVFFFDERQENLSNVELMNNAGIPGKLAAVATLPAVFR